MAREFDSLSREDGRDWPAVRFVEWLADEAAATAEAAIVRAGATNGAGSSSPAEVSEAA